ncbi:NfeD family protein [Rhizobium leucaenae]|jgi:membrane protein implicated in regulation of membrane protease activity|uniref:Membrane protein implicated in regulation of membrane protease activity n=1 Tax=Rhizobium leucaenae TaxID=29450 RepID=A0A7W7EK54_9HYPH|nr:membrane protein [Rhizobium leucaenae]MBB4568531.1 membrane protein implicated in regulation of membrane protease activity [Rhizobium leucaenae]MBB6300309.1 membrane protein implicated in regulation of membrane protease activity [Rhizobium leucaenae]
MPQIIFFIVAVGGIWLLYRRFVRDARKLTEKSRRAESERRTGAIGTLVKDPKTGEYRVKREDE